MFLILPVLNFSNWFFVETSLPNIGLSMCNSLKQSANFLWFEHQIFLVFNNNNMKRVKWPLKFCFCQWLLNPFFGHPIFYNSDLGDDIKIMQKLGLDRFFRRVNHLSWKEVKCIGWYYRRCSADCQTASFVKIRKFKMLNVMKKIHI